ncbi:MAG: HAMP domain-containing sensor histidine kinase [Bacteroidota bacterium]
MKDKQILLLSIFAALALLGLLLTQYYWLRDALVLQEEKYNNQVYGILKEIDDVYEDRIELKYDMDAIVSSAAHPEAPQFLLELQAVIEQKLEQLQYAYHFALVSLDHTSFQYFSDVDKSELTLREGIRKKLGVGLHPSLKADLPKDGKHHFYLYLYLPNKQQFIYQDLHPILLSALCSLTLIAIFIYTIYIINKQKKLTAMKNDFINHLTHEFKTPIASISLATKTLHKIEPIKVHPQASRYINLIAEESTRLENHVDKVLQLSLLDTNNFELDKSTVDVHQLIHRVTDSLKLVVEAADGRYQLDLMANETEIQADRMHLFNVLYNLIDNAIKYTKTQPIIKIETQSTEQHLSIKITDNGIGMSEEEQAFIFDRFYRSKKEAVLKNGGFGLGLSYVKQVLDAHQARVQIESKLGAGTSFELVFPSIKIS